MSEQVASEFVHWFQLQHGNLETAKVGIVEFPGHGRGAIALQDIPVRSQPYRRCASTVQSSNPYLFKEDYTLFTIPRELTLSTRTCLLPNLLGQAWKEHGLHEGWAGLILCMMWEESRGADSKWSGYLGQS